MKNIKDILKKYEIWDNMFCLKGKLIFQKLDKNNNVLETTDKYPSETWWNLNLNKPKIDVIFNK
jgi:hypothetical protein